MKLHYPGNALARYRDQTAVKGNNMNGVMAPSFRCIECGRSRATKGRKKTATGWRCAACHQARECYAQSQAGVPKSVPRVCVERGVSAAAAAKRAMTHCKRGHALSGGNLFITSQGSRGCKECRKIHKRTYMEKARG